MNSLQKLKTLLSKEDRTIKIGALRDETTFPIITIETGESDETEHYIYDNTAIYKPVYNISVYSNNYEIGYDLLDNLINEIKDSEKQSMYILHTKTFESVYDENKNLYTFKAQFKEIKINN